MAFRSEAHKTLSLLFARDDVPPACVCNSAKEMIQGNCLQKLKDATCQLKQLKTYIPWLNAAEREIYKLKKGAGCIPLQSRAPKHLWGDCLELEGYTRSNTAYDI